MKKVKNPLQELIDASKIKALTKPIVSSHMTPDAFVYWLQGFLEMENPKTLNKKQTQILKDHLDLVFNKVTPKRNKTTSLPKCDMPYPGDGLFCASSDKIC